jgi:hypothetical protein
VARFCGLPAQSICAGSFDLPPPPYPLPLLHSTNRSSFVVLQNMTTPGGTGGW